jgi:hypothetical protein
MKKILSVLGILVLIFIGYWLFIVVPARKDCVAKAQEEYNRSTTNAREELINQNQYKNEQNTLQARINNCYK